MDCGSTWFTSRWAQCAYTLEFDHRPGTEKRRNVSRLYLGAWQHIENEIACCDIVCPTVIACAPMHAVMVNRADNFLTESGLAS